MKGKLIKVNEIYTLMCDDKMIASNDVDFQVDYEVQKLSTKNCKAIEFGYDLDELAEKHSETLWGGDKDNIGRASFYIGAKTILELLGDKKFSLDDVRKVIEMEKKNAHVGYFGSSFDVIPTDEIIQSLQQTEWDVEIVMDKDCYSSDGRCDNSTMVDCIICTPVTYLKDADGCLILKKINV